MNRDITGMLERLFQRIFMRKGLLWKNTTGKRIRLGDGENPMTEEMNIPDRAKSSYRAQCTHLETHRNSGYSSKIVGNH